MVFASIVFETATIHQIDAIFLQPVFQWRLRLHNNIWRYNPMYCVFESDIM